MKKTFEQLDLPAQSTKAVTVGSLLQLPEICLGLPEVLCGHAALGMPVRWVHIADPGRAEAILEGGELILSTGQGFGNSSSNARIFLDELEAAGAAGVVVELVNDKGFPDGPAIEALRKACSGRKLTVVLLSHRIRFVRVTYAAHRMLLGHQLVQIERAQVVHETFTRLTLDGASPQQIVNRAAALLAAPVVLEDVSHNVLAFDVSTSDPGALLANWIERSRCVGFHEETGRRGSAESWLQSPVGISGRRWGRLVIPSNTPDDKDAALVLERASQALTIAGSKVRDEGELLRQARASFLHDLRQSVASKESEAQSRAAALGLQLCPSYLPLVARLDRMGGEGAGELEFRTQALLQNFYSLASRKHLPLLAASIRSGSIAVILGIATGSDEYSLLRQLNHQLLRAQSKKAEWVIGVASSSQSLLESARDLDEALQVSDIASTMEGRQRPFYRLVDVRLRGLLGMLRTDPSVMAFAKAELRPILNEADSDSLDLLELYLTHGGNKSALARTGYMSRTALYARLERLEQRLGVSLGDAESRTALHVALLWHRLERSNARSESEAA